MAMKIKFPLKMADGSQVRTIEELKEHFDLASVLKYYDNGKLVEWLADRYYDVEAEKIKTLEPSSKEFKRNLCEILAVPYSETEADDVDLAKIAAKNERYERLKQFTADDTILAAVDMVAFTQEDLADLLDKDAKLIYLCGERFRIPCSKGGVTYLGVNNPVVDVAKGYDEKGIVFKGVQGKNILDDSMKNVSTAKQSSVADLPKASIKKAAKKRDLTVKLESGQAVIEDGDRHSEDHLSFRMTIEKVFPITGRGVVAEGKIELGNIHTGDEVEIVAVNNVYTTIVLGIEVFRRILDYAEVGDNVGLLLRGVQNNQVKKGQVIRKYGEIKIPSGEGVFRRGSK